MNVWVVQFVNTVSGSWGVEAVLSSAEDAREFMRQSEESDPVTLFFIKEMEVQ